MSSCTRSKVISLMRRSPLPSTSRRDHDLADDLAVLDQPQPLARLIERQHLVDHRLELAVGDEPHQRLEIVVVETVLSYDLELEAPDVAQVLLRVVTGGGAADHELAAALEAAQRRLPAVAAGEVDHHVDAAVVAAPLRLAVLLDRPFGEIGLLDVYHLVGAERLELAHLLRARGAGDHLGAEMLGENDRAGADAAAGAENEHAIALLHRVVGDQHAVDRKSTRLNSS